MHLSNTKKTILIWNNFQVKSHLFKSCFETDCYVMINYVSV